jgi:hypothetical protein
MEALSPARTELHRVAVHVVARARIEATGRFSLRVTPGGFGTPEFGSDARRVRVSGSNLVVESDAVDAAAANAMAIDGSSLAELAQFAGVDLTETIDVGNDTPPLGDVKAPIALDTAAATELAEWFEQFFVGRHDHKRAAHFAPPFFFRRFDFVLSVAESLFLGGGDCGQSRLHRQVPVGGVVNE